MKLPEQNENNNTETTTTTKSETITEISSQLQLLSVAIFWFSLTPIYSILNLQSSIHKFKALKGKVKHIR